MRIRPGLTTRILFRRVIAAFLSLSLPAGAIAATLSLDPGAGSMYYGVPSPFRMAMDTQGESVVVADPILIYDPASLRIDSVTPNVADPPGPGQFRFLARSTFGDGRVQVVVGTPHQTALNGSAVAVADILATPVRCFSPIALTYYFLAPGAGGDSNAIRDDGLGTDLLSAVWGGSYRVFPPPRGESSDYDADPAAEAVLFRPGIGLWAVRGVTSFYLGSSGDIPAPGDYTGDGKAEAAVYRISSGLWAVKTGARIYFGGASDLPVPGDWSGDGSCDIAVYRPADGRWAVRNLTRFFFGNSDDYPVPADFDHDGRAEAAIFRPSAGLWAVRNLTRLNFGRSGDVPIPADYDGNGLADVALFRPESGLWTVRGVTRVFSGVAGDIPVPADYTGTGGTARMGCFHPETGFWEVREDTSFYFGQAGDIPLSR
jgi:hypothetical protein